jgi:drug/metabolite transporter (DMT)-like permease
MYRGLVVLGIIILLIGLGASFYYESKTILGVEYQRVYPYQNLGIVLVIGGIVCIVVGAVYSPRKETTSHQAVDSKTEQKEPEYVSICKTHRWQSECRIF